MSFSRSRCSGRVPAQADASWLPHPADATWTYEWSDSVYNTTPTKEKVTVKEQNANAFLLEWTTQDLGNPDTRARRAGLMAFQDTSSGIVNTDWQSTPPPSVFPDPLRAGRQVRQQRRRNPLHADLGHARAGRSPQPLLSGLDLGEPRRRRQRRHELLAVPGP